MQNTISVYIMLLHENELDAVILNFVRLRRSGTTYWIDFESFAESGNALDSPGSCSNRQAQDYTNLNFHEYWTYTADPQDLENVPIEGRMAYPPSDWTFSVLSCNVVEYMRTFSWAELTQCVGAEGNTLITRTETDEYIYFDGAWSVELVSPYRFGIIDCL